MAEQETTVPIEDKGMLSDLMADRPETEPSTEPEQPEAAQPREDATGRLHGEAGRFVSKQAKEAEAAPTQQQEPAQETPQATQPTDDNAAQVPSWRLREVREAREAAERRAEEATRNAHAVQQRLDDMQRRFAEATKPKAEPVDFFSDPDGALNQRVGPIQAGFEQQFNELRLDMSRELAVVRYSEQAVTEMEAAIEQAMQQRHPGMAALAAEMRSSKFPALVAMQWHQREKTQREIGGDLNAYKTKLREELLGDPEFLKAAVAKATGQAQQAAAQPGTRPNVQLPPSLNKATGAGLSNSDPTDEADMSDRGLFRHAMGNRR
jgi:hypothetical protein